MLISLLLLLHSCGKAHKLQLRVAGMGVLGVLESFQQLLGRRETPQSSGSKESNVAAGLTRLGVLDVSPTSFTSALAAYFHSSCSAPQPPCAQLRVVSAHLLCLVIPCSLSVALRASLWLGISFTPLSISSPSTATAVLCTFACVQY